MTFSQRRRVIGAIVADLEHLIAECGPGFRRRAIEANLDFFRAARSPVTFLWWQLGRARRVDADHLLELADFPLTSWQAQLYRDLGWAERKSFPGLLTPLVQFLSASNAKTFLDFGCGAMATERQVILAGSGLAGPGRFFLGLDSSPVAWDLIQETFGDMADAVQLIRIQDLIGLDPEGLLSQSICPNVVAFLNADVTALAPSGKVFDIAFSSKFAHHLNYEQNENITQQAMRIAKRYVEYDDYKSSLSWIPPTLMAWRRPVLLNGALLSRLRQPTKRQLLNFPRFSHVTFHSPPGAYIAEVCPPQPTSPPSPA